MNDPRLINESAKARSRLGQMMDYRLLQRYTPYDWRSLRNEGAAMQAVNMASNPQVAGFGTGSSSRIVGP
jgi:hypothetical protein